MNFRSFLIFALLITVGKTHAHSFDTDSRKEFDGSKFPASAVGRLNTPDGYCTATLVGKNIILTAAHCVLDRETLAPKLDSEFTFYPGYKNGPGSLKSGLSQRKKMAWGTGNPFKEPLNDWALVEISENLGEQAGWIDVGRPNNFQNEVLNKMIFTFIGYNGDYKDGEVAQMEENCGFKGSYQNKEQLWLTNCSGSGGGSGGPILVFPGPNRVVIAALFDGGFGTENLTGIPYSDAKANFATPISPGLIHSLREMRGEIPNK